MELSGLLSKKTKIVCTIGPASQSQTVLERMIASGMNIARINFAHGDQAGHRLTIANVRAAAAAVGARVSIFGDLPGPKMRIGRLIQEPIELQAGQPFTLQTQDVIGDDHRVSMSFKQLPQVAKPGDSIFVNDGFIQLEVVRVESLAVHCRVLVGGELRSHKGVNLPNIDLGISAFTTKDEEYLRFAAEEGLDGVSQSFVESADDIAAVRAAAEDFDFQPFIIAKIERSRALDNLPAILDSADGIMVARGDLGVEIPIEQIAPAQKRIISAANLSGKPVITATHMLESMTYNARPTRAEATDVANAILDGTDCVMLSGETAVGKYSAEAVAMMARIAEEAESYAASFGVAEVLETQKSRGEISRQDLVAFDIYLSARTLKPELVFVPSASGGTARRVTRFRLNEWIVAPSLRERTCQELQFSYGVYPVFLASEPESWSKYAQEWLAAHKIDSNLILVVQGAGTNRYRDTTRLDIIDLTN